MRITRSGFYRISAPVLLSLQVAIFYVVLLLAFVVGFAEATRYFSIPYRLLILVLYLSVFVVGFNRIKMIPLPFVIFAFIYLLKIMASFVNGDDFYISNQEWLLYFVAFCFIPFISLSVIDPKSVNWNLVFNCLQFSLVIFSTLVIIFYSRFLGSVSRLSSSLAGELVLSPLILSYLSALTIGTLIIYMVHNKVGSIRFVLFWGMAGIAFIPYVLGASRGSLIALFVSLMFVMIARLKVERRAVKLLLLAIFVTILVLFFDSYYDSGLIRRFLSISSDIEQGSSSAVRLQLWRLTWEGFVDFPLFGVAFLPNLGYVYPHNIYLETLQTVGVVGFLPFIYIFSKSIYYGFLIVRTSPQLSWVVVIFVQASVAGFFSGAVYSVGNFWASMALVILIGKHTAKCENPTASAHHSRLNDS